MTTTKQYNAEAATWTDSKGRVFKVAKVAPVVASGKIVGLYAPDGALIARIAN